MIKKNLLQLKKKECILPFLIFILIFMFYLLWGYGVTISNDSTSNLEQIKAMDILSRSSHFSFHLFGVTFYSFFSLLLGLSPITSVEIMLSVFSLLGTIALYSVIRNKFNDRFLSLITVLIYAFSTGVFRFSIQSEYLILVPSFALISLALYVKNLNLFAGIAFALGLLTSPFIFLFSPAFLIYNNWETIFSKKNLWFVAGFLALYLSISYFTFSETINGEWSYSLVFNAYKKIFIKINYLKVASIWFYGYLRSFILIIPLIFYGLILCFRKEKKLFYIIFLLIIFHLPVAIPEARYGGYQLTLYPFIALLAAFGVKDLFEKTKMGALGLLGLFLLLNFYIVTTERHFNRSLRDTYTMLQKDTSVADSSVLFVYQAIKPIRTVYAPRLKTTSMMTDKQEVMAENFGYRKPMFAEIFDQNENIYLLESGVSMPDDHLKLLFGRFVKGQGSKVKGFGREKLLPYVGTAKFTRLKGYPLDVYKIEKQ
jgi:hypothetical protein